MARVSDRLRLPIHHRWLWGGGVVLLLGVLATVYVVWSGMQAKDELEAAKKDAETVRAALKDDDNKRAESALASFAKHANKAHDHASGFVWRVSEWTPFLGKNPKALRLVSKAAADLGNEGQRTFDSVGGSNVLTRLSPRGGRIDLSEVAKLQPAMGRLAGVIQADTAALDDINAEDLIGSARKPYSKFLEELLKTRDTIRAANNAVQVMPTALGQSRPQNYLLLFGNNAELRTWGGTPGSWALVRADKGKLSIVRQGNAGDFGPYLKPTADMTAEEQAIYGPHPVFFFQDTGFTPEFPRTAQFATALWKTRYQDKLDGVFELDTVTLSYLLRATGPVKVPGDVTLTSANAVDELLNKAYLRISDTKQQDEFFAKVARLVFEKFTRTTSSPSTLVTALSQATSEGRVHLNFADSELQQQLAGTTIAGQLHTRPQDPPELALYLNDATAAKMSYYLSFDLKTTSTSCSGGTQQLSSTATFHQKKVPQAAIDDDYISGAGLAGTPRGKQLVQFRIFGPVGGKLSDVRFDGKKITVEQLSDRGRPVVVSVVQLTSDQTVKVTWKTRTADDQKADVRQILSPGLTAHPMSASVRSTC